MPLPPPLSALMPRIEALRAITKCERFVLKRDMAPPDLLPELEEIEALYGAEEPIWIEIARMLPPEYRADLEARMVAKEALFERWFGLESWTHEERSEHQNAYFIVLQLLAWID